MRPQWSEAAVLLAAHDFTPVPHQASVGRNRCSHWSLKPMPPKPYALFRETDGQTSRITDTKPVVFDTLAQLAAHIERRRADRMIELEEFEDLEFQGDDRLHIGVRVWALDMAGDRDTVIGLAWLDGQGRTTLEPALRRVRARYDRRAA